MTTIPLHSGYHPLTRREIDIIDRAMCKLLDEHSDGVPVEAAVAELLRMGIPTAERAKLALEMFLLPGGPPTTMLGMLVAKHSELETAELVAAIDRHLPGTPVKEIVAELRRQGAAATTEASELKEYFEAR